MRRESEKGPVKENFTGRSVWVWVKAKSSARPSAMPSGLGSGARMTVS